MRTLFFDRKKLFDQEEILALQTCCIRSALKRAEVLANRERVYPACPDNYCELLERRESGDRGGDFWTGVPNSGILSLGTGNLNPV